MEFLEHCLLEDLVVFTEIGLEEFSPFLLITEDVVEFVEE